MKSEIHRCPHCGKKINAASILGAAGKGKAKTISEADRLGRSERMKALNAKRRSEPANLNPTSHNDTPKHHARPF